MPEPLVFATFVCERCGDRRRLRLDLPLMELDDETNQVVGPAGESSVRSAPYALRCSACGRVQGHNRIELVTRQNPAAAPPAVLAEMHRQNQAIQAALRGHLVFTAIDYFQPQIF